MSQKAPSEFLNSMFGTLCAIIIHFSKRSQLSEQRVNFSGFEQNTYLCIILSRTKQMFTTGNLRNERQAYSCLSFELCAKYKYLTFFSQVKGTRRADKTLERIQEFPKTTREILLCLVSISVG
jgi:hypothetical protein